jgi:hypothetical protein
VLVRVSLQVHPYVNLAWTITSSVYKVNTFTFFFFFIDVETTIQAVKGQIERDAQDIELIKAMDDTYSFVDAVEFQNKLKVFEDTTITNCSKRRDVQSSFVNIADVALEVPRLSYVGAFSRSTLAPVSNHIIRYLCHAITLQNEHNPSTFLTDPTIIVQT